MEVKIKTVLHKYALLLTLLIFYVPSSLLAQTISAPTLGLPGNPVTAFCANEGSVTYQSTFTISGTFGGGNQFILELSNASGSFVSPTQVSNVASFSGNTGTFTFTIPFGIAGQSYKFRVRSTAPALTSSSSATVPAYYEPFNKNFFINNKISSVNICGSGTFTLSVDNPGPSEPSPLSTPGLTYIWKRNTIVLPGQTGSSININTAGDYSVAVDYGACTPTSSAYSQTVTVNIVAAGATFTITPGSGTICPSTPVVLSTTAGYTYQWFKDAVSIAGANSYNYVATQPGAYQVLVNQGGCSSSSNTVTLTATDFNASIDVLELPQTNIIAAGETKIITVTTDAISPTYEWYLNGALLPAETTNVLSTSTPGDYKVVINQTSGCVTSKSLFFKIKEGVNPVRIPNVVSPNGDEVNDTWIIPQEYIAENTEILIITGTGEIALKTNNYQNNWPESALEFKSVNPVYYYIITKDGKEVKKGSITIIK